MRRHPLTELLLLVFGLTLLPVTQAAPPIVTITPNALYQTEHCLFVIDSSVTWATPATAYNQIYGYSGNAADPFPKLKSAFDTLVAQFPGSYFSICYLANTGASNVPNYIDNIYKASGINEGGTPGAPQSFLTVDICRYNLSGGSVSSSTLGVFDHELGHAWGARAFYNLTPPSLSNGHWLPNSTVDCQMSATYSADGYVTLNKLYGDPAAGFRWQKVDNLRSNDYEVFSEQTLYLLGVRKTWPTAYVLNNVVYNADFTASSSSVDAFDHAAMVAAYGARNPDYTTAPKRFKVGFVYIARDLAEVNTVYQAVEKSADQFCNAEAIDTQTYRFQTPFLCNTKYRASVDGLLADLDGNATPALTVTDGYVTSNDGSAVVNFSASDPDGPAPAVSVVPASTSCTVVGSTVQVAGLPDGIHFFTLKATDAGGKKMFGHFVVEVARPAATAAITGQPAGQTVTAGNPASFSVTATGSPASFTYQWFRQATRESTWNALGDSVAYSGSATATLLVASTPAMSGDEFLCVVGHASGTVTSHTAALVVTETAPALTTQPADRSVSTGTVVYLTVAAGGTTTFGYYYYQWQRLAAGSGVWTNLTDGGSYSGTATASLRITSSLPLSGDQFRCVVSNTTGTATSNAAVLTIGTVPTITTQPVSPVTVGAGQPASFSVVAAGSAPLVYQWSRYGVPVSGATSATLSIANAQAADAGAYTVAVTNAFGATTSNVGSLTVTPAAPIILTQPQALTATWGQTISLAVSVTGTTPFTYQWQKNNVNLPGANSSTLTLANVVASDAGAYRVIVSNSINITASYSAILTVDGAAMMPSDFNADGKVDLLWENTATGERGLWLMNGAAFAAWVSFGVVPVDWRAVDCADFDANGSADILWENTATGEHGIWLMSGTTVTTWVSYGLTPSQWRMAAIGDLNTDGKPDILWENTSTGEHGVWLMNGTAFSSWLNYGVSPLAWHLAATGDFNGDGKTDILWENTSTGERGLWLMNGTAFSSWQSLGIVPTDWRMVP